MNEQIKSIQEGIIQTLTAIYEGNFTQLCAVKKSMLHLEAIYFCHSTCRLVGQEYLSLAEQLTLYREIGLIPQSTVTFFEKWQDHI